MATGTYVDDPRDRAFERLYERYVRDVYRYVLAVLRNPTEAEDVTQTTFLNAYRAIQAGEEPQKPHNWLIAIAHNACRTRVRFAMRRPKEVPLDDVVEQLAVPDVERPNVRELLRALGRLPFNQRAAITMRELEGRSYTEIAETLGVTVPAAEALIARARRTLRSQAAALRGLVFIGLPRSLRSFFENPDASGGAIGAAAVAKAAAVIVAGVVAGGIGYTATSDAQSTGGGGAPQTQRAVVRHATVAHAATATALRRVVRRPATASAAALPAVQYSGRRPTLPPEDEAAAASVPAAAPASPAQAPASAPAAGAPAATTQTAQAAVAPAVTAVEAVVAQVPAPPTVSVPAVPSPPVAPPALP